LGAGIAHAAWFGLRLVRFPVPAAAIEGHSQDARDGRFPYPTVAAEDVSVRDALLLDGILQGAGDVFLPDHVGKSLRTVLAGQDLIAHGRTRLYVSGFPRLRGKSRSNSATGRFQRAKSGGLLELGLAVI